MIWETDVLVIVMACNEHEAGKHKCEPYWPQKVDEKQQYGNITGKTLSFDWQCARVITLSLSSFSVVHLTWCQVCPDFLVRTFRVSADNEERTICQFHYTTWPDHGVPDSVHPILELVRLMRDSQSTESRPILVHCSAGCGRTGTICSIDYVWALLKSGKLREDFSLFEIIADMRRQRTSMVQTVEQYILCYRAVSTLFEQHLKLIDAHTYENVDGDGEPLGSKEKEDGDSLNLSSEPSLSSDTATTVNTPELLISVFEPPIRLTADVLKAETSENKQKVSTANHHHPENGGEVSYASTSTYLHRSRSIAAPADSTSDDLRNEKVVGKATVIRRPSIAKLKALFDNPTPSASSSSSSSQLLSNQLDLASTQPTDDFSARSRLQRSQSIKENIRNVNATFNINLDLSLNQPQSKKSKSYTLSAAKLSVYKKHYSIGNLALGADDQLVARETPNPAEQDCEESVRPAVDSGLVDQRNPFQKPQTHSRIDHLMEDLKLESRSRFREQTVAKSRSESQMGKTADAGEHSTAGSHGQSSTGNSEHTMIKSSVYSRVPLRSQTASVSVTSRPPSLDGPGAPPKPPRTYQHIMDDSCIVRTSEGRLIVTVAQPRGNSRDPSESTTNFIPISRGGNQFAGFNQQPQQQHQQQQHWQQQGPPGQSSIYESIGPRKFNISSPNLVLPDQVTYMTPAEARMKAVQKSAYAEPQTANGGPSLYGNVLASKSYPRSIAQLGGTANSQTPLGDSFNAFLSNKATSYGVDVFGNQHFQYHQAKPAIILQQNFFEPIYSTTAAVSARRQPFLPPRTANLMPTQGTGGPSFVPPPVRPRSISQGTVVTYKRQQPQQPQHPHQLQQQQSSVHQYAESIYSNREMCFSMGPNAAGLNGQMMMGNKTNGHQANFAPIRIQPKENVYAEIGTLKAATSVSIEPQQRQNGTEKSKSTLKQGNMNSTSDSNLKYGAFSKIRNVLKVFRLKGSSGSSGKSTSTPSNNSIAPTEHHRKDDSSKCSNYSTSGSSGTGVPNGAAINPLNGKLIVL